MWLDALLVPANKAASATAPIAATVLSPAPAVSDMVAESKKKVDDLWSELNKKDAAGKTTFEGRRE